MKLGSQKNVIGKAGDASEQESAGSSSPFGISAFYRCLDNEAVTQHHQISDKQSINKSRQQDAKTKNHKAQHDHRLWRIHKTSCDHRSANRPSTRPSYPVRIHSPSPKHHRVSLIAFLVLCGRNTNLDSHINTTWRNPRTLLRNFLADSSS